MSVQNYLNNKESILFLWEMGPKGESKPETEKKVKVNVLGSKY